MTIWMKIRAWLHGARPMTVNGIDMWVWPAVAGHSYPAGGEAIVPWCYRHMTDKSNCGCS